MAAANPWLALNAKNQWCRRLLAHSSFHVYRTRGFLEPWAKPLASK